MVFRDRHEAGRRLAPALSRYRDQDAVVVGLPRGGVPVAHEVAKALNLPLEVFITRKIGVPGDPELAAGAVAESGEVFLDQHKIDLFTIHPMYLEREIARQKEEIAHLQQVCRGGKARMELKNRIVIVVDDGVATGANISVTLRALKREGVKWLVLAVPVAPLDVVDELKRASDELVVLAKPYPFYAVGAAYQRFEPVSDEEVAICLGTREVERVGDQK